MQRANAAGGTLIYRTEDLDPQRCKIHYASSALEDLRWLGIKWSEGPDLGGPKGPYCQSERSQQYLQAWQKLQQAGFIYPCQHSRKDVEQASQAPHVQDSSLESIYPIGLRPPVATGRPASSPGQINWRFRVPLQQKISFIDRRLGEQTFECQHDFGDFLVWRRDGVPAYELAVVVDDAAMQINEVVRGEDLLQSTARQLLIYRALKLTAPNFYHTALLCDDQGRRLAKRTKALSLREMRDQGMTRTDILNLPAWSS